VLDTSGAPLAAALASGQPLHAVKPNRAELEALLGRALPTIADVIAAARSLLDRGVALVVVSLGADGALSGSAVIKQSDWGISPYSTLFGALKVADTVEVAIDASLG